MHNQEDVLFAQQLVAVNQQGRQMSELVVDRTQDAELKSFASQTAQRFLVETKKAVSVLEAWGSGLPREGTAKPDDIDGMVSHQEIKQLGNATGADFDALYVRLMLAKTSGTASLAAAELADGRGRAGLTLAREVSALRAKQLGDLQRMSR